MVEIDIEKLRKYIDELNSILNEYDTVRLNLYNQLKEAGMNWDDNWSREFQNEIEIEKHETEEVIKSFNSKKKIYDYLHTKYSEIGKKIKCNLNSKSTIIGIIDNCYQQSTDIINSFYNVDTSFSYPEKYWIFQQRGNIESVRANLSTLKDSMNKIFKKIENIETAVNAKISQLEQLSIREFDFDIKTI